MALNFIIGMQGVEIVTIISSNDLKTNSDSRDLKKIAEKYRIPYYDLDALGEDVIHQSLNGTYVDVTLVVGWSRILSSRLLNKAKMKNIGFHPAELPKNRGRHPII